MTTIINGRSTRFTVVGAGAIGGVMGVGLAEHGASVTLVDRDPDHVAAMAERGLTIDGEGTQTCVRVRAMVPDQVQGPLDAVIVAVKSQDTAGVLRWLLPLLTPDSAVVSLQNGLNHEAIAGVVGAHRTIGAFVNYQASYLSPGLIQFGRRGSLSIGEMNGAITPRLGALQTALNAVRPTTISANIHGLLWSKLAYGAVLIATAAVDAPAVEVLRRHPRLMGSLAAEVIRVGRAAGVRFEEFDVFTPADIEHPDGPAFASAYGRILRSWEDRPIKYTGIWRDLMVRRRKTEVAWETGLVVERGAALNVPTPLNARLTQQIGEIEAGERGMAWSNLDELAALVRPLPSGAPRPG
jgi:2-dehydropantoate 2-reductase